jgi:hypothetical protein
MQTTTSIKQQQQHFFFFFISGSKIRLVTLDVTIMLIRELVISKEKSFLSDDHFAQVRAPKS